VSRQCTACRSDDRDTIDAGLLRVGVTVQEVADAHGLSHDSVWRHARNHLPERLALAAEAEEVASADALLDEITTLIHRVKVALDRTEARAVEGAGSEADVQGWTRELRGALTLLAAVSERLPPAQVMVLSSPEWVQVRGVMTAALRPFPEAAKAAAQALKSLG